MLKFSSTGFRFERPKQIASLQLRTELEKLLCVQGEADQPALVLRPLARNDNAVAFPSLARLAILFDQPAAARAAGVPGRHA